MILFGSWVHRWPDPNSNYDCSLPPDFIDVFSATLLGPEDQTNTARSHNTSRKARRRAQKLRLALELERNERKQKEDESDYWHQYYVDKQNEASELRNELLTVSDSYALHICDLDDQLSTLQQVQKSKNVNNPDPNSHVQPSSNRQEQSMKDQDFKIRGLETSSEAKDRLIEELRTESEIKDEATKSFNTQQKKLRSKNNSAMKEIEKLKKHIAQVQDEEKLHIEGASTHKDDIEKLETQLCAAEDDNLALRTRIDELEKLRIEGDSTNKENIEKLETQLRAAEDGNRALRTQVNELESRLETADSIILEQGKTAVERAQGLGAANAAAEALRTELNAVELKAQGRYDEEMRNANEWAHAKLNDTVQHYEHQIRLLHEQGTAGGAPNVDIEKLWSEINTKDHRLQEAEREQQQLNLQFQAAEQEYKKLEAELQRLREDAMAQIKAKNADFREEEKKRLNEIFASSMKSVRIDKEALNLEMQQFEEAQRALEARDTKLKQAERSCKRRLDRLQNPQHVQWDARIQRAEQAAEEYFKKHENIYKWGHVIYNNCTKLREEVTALQGEVNRLSGNTTATTNQAYEEGTKAVNELISVLQNSQNSQSGANQQPSKAQTENSAANLQHNNPQNDRAAANQQPDNAPNTPFPRTQPSQPSIADEEAGQPGPMDRKGKKRSGEEAGNEENRGSEEKRLREDCTFGPEN